MNPYVPQKTQYQMVEETLDRVVQINYRLAQAQARTTENKFDQRKRKRQDEIERVKGDYQVMVALERDEPVWPSDEICRCWGSTHERPHLKLKIGGIKETLCPVVICLKVQKSCLRHGRNMDVSIYDKLMSLARPTTSATLARQWTRCAAG